MGAAWARFASLRLVAMVVFVVVLGGAIAIAMRPKPGPETGPTASPQPRAVETTPKPYQQVFGPNFAAERPAGPFRQVEGAMLSHDRRTLYLSFIGGAGFTPDSWCGEDYAGWAAVVAGELEFAVYSIPHPEQVTPPPNGACTAEGHGYVFELWLPQAFHGAVVRNLAVKDTWVPAPELTAEIATLPEGWILFEIGTTGGSLPNGGTLGRLWGPSPAMAVTDGRFWALEQVFRGSSEFTVDNAIAQITVHGQAVDVAENGPDGFIAAWMFGVDGYRLTTIDPDVTLEEFEAIANGIAIPPP